MKPHPKMCRSVAEYCHMVHASFRGKFHFAANTASDPLAIVALVHAYCSLTQNNKHAKKGAWLTQHGIVRARFETMLRSVAEIALRLVYSP